MRAPFLFVSGESTAWIVTRRGVRGTEHDERGQSMAAGGGVDEGVGIFGRAGCAEGIASLQRLPASVLFL